MTTNSRRGRLPPPFARLLPLVHQLAAWRRLYGRTAREADVVEQLLLGLSNAEVAAALGISPHAARHHTERALDKLGVRSRAAVGALMRGAPALLPPRR